MISFIMCLAILVAGYIFYGRYVERKFEPDDRETPAVLMEDGVDYVVLPEWRVFLIQLLNIAGLGPIWGAVCGAMWGPQVFLWITFGAIFAGGVHDFASGFISMRNKGMSISEACEQYMGKTICIILRIFSIALLFMTGVVFAKGPAGLLAYLCGSVGNGTGIFTNTGIWLIIILVYYFIATFVSIDKIIGKIYPVFGFCLVAMAIGVGGGIIVNGTAKNIPEIWTAIGSNMHPAGTGAWPVMFISVACGAISGFHSTQSPIMARCCKSERQIKKVFYGAMISEGVIALVWAAASCALFPIVEGKMTGLSSALSNGQAACIYSICSLSMGKIGVVLAMLGVIVCPITSGDTALRSVRLTISDWFKIDQKNWKKRFLLSLPLIVAVYFVCQLDYTTVWSYSASINQILAMIVLWAASEYLKKEGKRPWITLIPAVFMSFVTMTFVFSSDIYLGKLFGSSAKIAGNIGGIAIGVIFLILFFKKPADLHANLQCHGDN